jgi:hypothetical protein
VSAIEIFRLRPGQALLYEVHTPGSGLAEALHARIRRTDGALAGDLEIELRSASGRTLSRGRIAIDSGYLAVLREVRRQLAGAGTWEGGEIELSLVESPVPPRRVEAK